MKNKLREKSEVFGLSYGVYSEDYNGIVTNLTTLPDKTFFYVHNGGYNAYIEKENDMCYIYCGVTLENPTSNYTKKIAIDKNYTYDAIITIVDGKPKHSVLLTEEEIKCFMSYIENNDMKKAFSNEDWCFIYNKITNGKQTDKIKQMIKGDII